MKPLFSLPPLNGQAAFGTAHISGRELGRMLRRSSPSQRAVIADDLRTGRLEVGPLTERQARWQTGASHGYVHIVSKLTDPERTAVADGSRKLSEFAGRRCEPTDAEVGRFVQRVGTVRLVRIIGANTLMAAIECHTAPPINGASNDNDRDASLQLALSL